MKKIIIGSTAIKHWFPDFNREPKDLDYAYDGDKVISTREIEYLPNPIILKYTRWDKYLEPDLLLTLKASHLILEINWAKHMFDCQFLLKKGCVIETEVFNELVEYWKTSHPKVKRSKLEMSKDDFFTNAINYDVNSHDDLHLLINPTPMYKKLLKEGCEVELDEEKFHILSKNEKLDVIREEVYVMGYERYAKLNYRLAYKRMLDKFTRTHAPTYMIPFIVENYIELLKPQFNFIDVIENGLKINK